MSATDFVIDDDVFIVVENTHFGTACNKFARVLIKIVLEHFKSWDYDNTEKIRVVLPGYHSMFKARIGCDKLCEFPLHELLYGKLKIGKDGSTTFRSRMSDEQFWMYNWGYRYSPFRIVQKFLKYNCNLYLVDHSTSDDEPCLFLQKTVVSFSSASHKSTWHNGHIIPCLTDADFKFVPKRKEYLMERIDDLNRDFVNNVLMHF